MESFFGGANFDFPLTQYSVHYKKCFVIEYGVYLLGEIFASHAGGFHQRWNFFSCVWMYDYVRKIMHKILQEMISVTFYF